MRVRPSAIETFQRCPLRWVLGAVGAEASPDTTRTVGTAVHAVAQQVAEGLPPADAPAVLAAELDQLDLGPGLVRPAAAAVGAGDAGPVPRLARGQRPRAASASRSSSTSPSAGRASGARSTGWSATPRAGWSSSTSRPGKTRGQEHRGARPAGRLPGGRRRRRVRRSTAASRAARRCCRSAPAPRPRSSTRSRCPPTCRWPRPGPASSLAEVGEGMGAATFEVRTGSHCSRCPARRSCPLQEPGRQVTG